jgi:hypothetical protein
MFPQKYEGVNRMLREKLGNMYDFLKVTVAKAIMAKNELKENEKAMEVIQVVMLVAVGVIAIAAVWSGVNGLLEKWWGMITGASGSKGGPNTTVTP